MKKANNFDKLLIKSIDVALKEIFGDTGASLIYNHLQRDHSLKPENIPERLEDFESGLKEFLNSGAWVTERIALKTLYSSFGLEYQNQVNYGFSDHVAKLKKQL